MDSNKVANWVQVGANFGLLAGLVLVAVQINQNSEQLVQTHQLAIAEATNNGFSILSQQRSAILGEEPMDAIAKACTNQPLSDKEALVLHYWFSQLVNYSARRRAMSEAAFTEYKWEASDNGEFFELFSTQTGRTWWKIHGVNSGLHAEVIEIGNRVYEEMRDFECRDFIEAFVHKAP